MKRRKFDPKALPAKSASEIDDRLQIAVPLRRLFNKVFPDHWSFLLGEIALYSFIVLLLTGTFLTFWFDPSMTEVRYNGSYTPLKGIEMSQAYRSSLDLSFEVRGGLVMRQMHHWSALMFMAGTGAHRAQRGRRAHVPGVRGQGRRVLHDRVRRDRAAGRALPDQPDLAVRPLQGRARLLRQPARLVRDVPRRVHPSDAAVGGPLPAVAGAQLHPAAAVLAHGRPARCADHAAAVLPVHRGAVHQGQAGPPPAPAA